MDHLIKKKWLIPNNHQLRGPSTIKIQSNQILRSSPTHSGFSQSAHNISQQDRTTSYQSKIPHDMTAKEVVLRRLNQTKSKDSCSGMNIILTMSNFP